MVRPHRRPQRLESLSIAFLILLVASLAPRLLHAQAVGALSSGLSAAAAGRGGILITEQGDPLDAMVGNPAGLAGVRTLVLEASGTGILAAGAFRNPVDTHGTLTGPAGAIPFVALALPVARHRWTFGIAATPDVLMRANWRYLDPPGTAGASYGLQTNDSEILALRTSLGAGFSIGRHWAAGATLGAVYNRNTLRAPYIFQQQPALAGLKVLLDLHTAGWGWNGAAGAQWQAGSRLRIGAAWKSETAISSRGQASGTASAQFAALGIAADPTFHYRAAVQTHLPQSAGIGLSFKQNQRLRWALDTGWLGWGNAFHRLPVALTDGANATINSVANSAALKDEVALDWHDQLVARLGVEAPLSERWTLRGGYGWMSDPVPEGTLTPMTAAILRNTLSTGAGWAHGRWGVDLAYQAQLPSARSVAHSSLLAGEYDDTRVRVQTQSLTLTARRSF